MSDALSNVVLKFKSDGAVAFNKTVKDINAIMNTAAKEYRAQVAAMNDSATAADKLAATQKKLATQLDAAGERTKLLKEQYEKMAKSSDTSTSALEKQKGKIADAERAESSLRSQLDKVNGQLTEQGKASLAAKEKLGSLESKAGDLETKEKALTASYSRQEAELGKDATNAEKNALAKRKLTEQTALTAKQVDNLEQQLKQTEAAYGANSREADEMRAKLDNAKASEANLKNQLSATNEAIRKQGGLSTETASKMEHIGTTGQKVSSVGKAMTMGLTVPIVGIGAAAVKTGGDFEAQMNRVGSISGATKGELKAMSDQAVDLGAKTVFNAKQSAEGMENLASAGFSAKETMKAIPGVLNLAAVSGGDVGKASEYAASALRGFGLDASQSGHVANVFAEAAAKTNAEVGDMGEAMKYIAPVAKAMGISIEESAAAVGIMSDAGVKGSQAGTTLRSSMARLADPTKKMKETMKDLNLSFFDSQGKMKPLASIIGMLKDHFKGLTKEQQAQAMSSLFGKESLSGMMSLVNAGPKKMESLTNSFKNSDGAAKKMAGTMNKGAKASIDQMMGSLESAAIKLTQVLAPAVTKVANFIGAMIDKFTKLSPAMQKTIVIIAAVVAAVGPLVLGIGKLMIAIGKIPATLAAVKSGFKLLATAMSPQALGITLIIAAVVALVTLIITHWTQIKEFLLNVWNAIKTTAETIWNSIKGVFSSVMNSIGTVVSTAWNAIKTVTVNVFNAIKTVITTVFNAIKVVIMTVIAVIKGIIEVGWAGIRVVTTVAWAAIKAVIVAVWNAIKGTVMPIVNAIKSGITTAWNAIKSATSKIFNSVKSVVSKIWNGIKSVVSNVYNAIKSGVKSAWNSIKSTTSSVFNAVKSVVSSIWNGIKRAISGPYNAIKSGVRSAWNSIKSTTSSVFNSIKSIASSIWNSIKSAISGPYNAIKSGVRNAWNSIKSTTSSVFNSIRNVASSVWNSIKNAMTSPINAAARTISGIINRIKGWFNGLRLRLPHIDMPPLPHFRLTGSFSLKPPSVPHLGVDWYAKGGIFTQPTIFGSAGGRAMGAGEAGPEAALPLNAETLGGIGKGIAAAMNGSNSQQPIILSIDGRTFAQISGPYMSDYLKQQDATSGFSRGRRPF